MERDLLDKKGEEKKPSGKNDYGINHNRYLVDMERGRVLCLFYKDHPDAKTIMPKDLLEYEPGFDVYSFSRNGGIDSFCRRWEEMLYSSIKENLMFYCRVEDCTYRTNCLKK